MLGLVPTGRNGRDAYRIAITYLARSQFAQEIIGDITNSPRHVGVLVTTTGGSEFIAPYQNKCPRYLDGGMVIWNSTMRVQTTDFASNDRRLAPDEPHREDVPWSREQRWGPWMMESVFGARTRIGHLSEAMCLMHELGHVMQYLSDPAGFQAMHRGGGLMDLENINVCAIEATIAQELRASGANETVRWDYMHQGHQPGGNAWPAWLSVLYE